MNENINFHVLDIIRGTTVDGPGFRTAIYLSGCSHQCTGCHNPQSWNPKAGDIMSLNDILDIVMSEDFDVTLTGGDPLFDPYKTMLLAKSIKEAGYGIWLYTGYVFEDILKDKGLSSPLPYIDVVVDGPYVESLRDPDLKFRGSSNQRIIPVRDLSAYNERI